MNIYPPLLSLPQLLYLDKTPVKYQHLMHNHDGICEILLIISGSSIYCIEGKQYNISAGDIVICNSGAVHDERPLEGESYITVCLGFTNLWMPGLPPNHLICDDQVPILHQPGQFQDIAKLVDLLLPRNRKAMDFSVSNALALACIYLVLQAAEDAAQMPKVEPEDTAISKVIDYIDFHYMEDLSLQSISEQFHFNSYYLSHLFKKTIGYSPMQYILRRRIGESQALLIGTRLKVAEISSQCGFGDPSHFNKIFYKYIGMTPTEYRKSRPEKMQDACHCLEINGEEPRSLT